MSEREQIFGRIREALRNPAPVPGAHHGESLPPVTEASAAPHIPEWLPLVGDSEAERLELFKKNSIELKADFRLLDSEEEVHAQIAELSADWKRVATHRNPLTDLVCDRIDLPILCTDGGYDAAEMEECDVGISACDALIAQTGSVLVTSTSAGGRSLSVLPPHHIVVARRDQLLSDLPSAFALLEERYAPDYPSFISFITGPSRTGDIERILVLGAHGPKVLTILCW